MSVKNIAAITTALHLFFVIIQLPIVEVNSFSRQSTKQRQPPTTLCSSRIEEEVDVIVVGSGIGGLSCAALSAKYGLKTLCLEAHDVPGGCAHSFDRYSSASKNVPFRFDAGPSLISGLSKKSLNPLRQLLDAVGVADEIDWHTYDGWVVHDYADGEKFRLTTGTGGEWEKAIEEKAGKDARHAFEKFRSDMKVVSNASGFIPPFALRGDASAIGSLSKYMLKLLSIGTKGALLTGSFTACMEKYSLKESFNVKWFDYLVGGRK